ncbi:ABC transporter permease subunit [Breznakiella homolactica]|uniref:ABC transporter permease subunit n=2 Tax=Breznakiella homolactica TaxID=2798577 RepID=A0A7T7XRR6_9SPIR|nr:ABC transporter permease subunit [Breznakiella homolactica]
MLVTVVFPLITMLVNLAGTDVAGIITSVQFRQALRHSLVSAAAGTVISIVIAYIFALCVARTNMPHRGVFSVLATVPMLIPSISHGFGLLILLGSNGILTRFFGWSGSVYGFGGIVIGAVLYAFPVAFLMLVDVLKYEDGSPYEAAAVLGIPRKNQFFSITFPYLRKPLISVVFATFTLIFTDYGIALMIGGRYMTLPVFMYQEVIGLLNFGKGSVVGAVLLIPAVIAFAFDLMNKDRGNQSFVVQTISKPENKSRDMAAMVYCVIICAAIALPIIVFAVISFVRKYPLDMRFSFDNVLKTMNLGAGRYLLNSLVISLGVSVLGTIVSYFTAYFTARTPGKSSKFLHLISITSLAIPGMVLGLSYVLFFKGSFIYGTIAILILVNTVHFMASPYLMAYNSLGKLNSNLEAVGLTLGISRRSIIKDVLIPQTKLTILEMFSYFFVNCMMTISAVSFLSTVRNKPISLMITQFEAQMLLESSAFVSLIILGCNLLMKTAVYLIDRKVKKSGEL